MVKLPCLDCGHLHEQTGECLPPRRCRVVWHMLSGRTNYSNWLSKVDAWHLIYNHSSLCESEWIGIEEEGQAVRMVLKGPWWNPDNRENQ
jgi:hypothetical protein